MQLPVSALPEVDYPTIQVVTFYPGADPEVMASSVTSPLERQFGQVPGLSQMTPPVRMAARSSRCSSDSIRTSMWKSSRCRPSINSASTYLPQDLPNPPIYNKANPADAPILTLALTSDSLPLPKVEDIADTSLAQKISQLPGVGLVSISGGQKPAVRIQANPTALASYGLSLEDLRAALVQANVDQAKGVIDGKRQSYTIGANDQLFSSEQYKPIVIAYRNGAPVRLSDVANVIDGDGEQSAGGVDEPDSRRDHEHPAAAGSQHHQRGGPDQEAAAATAGFVAERSQGADPDRPHHDDPSFGERCGVRVDALHRAGGDGGVPVPAESSRPRPFPVLPCRCR